MIRAVRVKIPRWLTAPDPASAAWPSQAYTWFSRLTANAALTDAVTTLGFALLAAVVWSFSSAPFVGGEGTAHSHPAADLALILTYVLAVAIRRTLPLVALAATTIPPVVVDLVSRLTQQELPRPWVSSALGPDSFLISLCAVALALFTVATLYRLAVTWTATAFAIGLYAIDTYLREYTPKATVFVVLLYAMSLIIVTLLGVSVRLQRLRMLQLEHLAARLALERDQREQLAVSAERTRIAREMHDVLAHSLAIIVTMADGAAANLERNPKMAATAIEQLSSTGRAALADTRRLVGVLRTEPATAPSPVMADIAAPATPSTSRPALTPTTQPAPIAGGGTGAAPGAGGAPTVTAGGATRGAPTTPVATQLAQSEALATLSASLPGPAAAKRRPGIGGLFARLGEKLAGETSSKQRLEANQAILERANQQEHAVILGQQPDTDVPLGPAPAENDLAELVSQFRGTGLPVRFERSGGPLPEDKGLQLALYRITQEALTNILRYAPTSPDILVRLARTTGTVELTVRNATGTGTTPMRGSGKGLVGMQERAAVYRGRVQAGPVEGGWQVNAIMHWNEAESEVTPWMMPR